MKHYSCIYILWVVLLASCNTQTSLDKGQSLLRKTIKASGGDSFYNSLITFTSDGINYSLERKGNITNFIMEREVDSNYYKATYNNGATAYYVNNELQPESFFSRRFIDTKLDGYSFLMGIPHVFDQNSVIADLEEDVIIGKQPYKTLHIWFKTISDDPENEFYLYIHPETYLVDFYTEKFDLNGESILLKKAFNQRFIKGISFADYKVFRYNPQDSLPLDKIYTKYNDRSIEYISDQVFEDVDVTLLDH